MVIDLVAQRLFKPVAFGEKIRRLTELSLYQLVQLFAKLTHDKGIARSIIGERACQAIAQAQHALRRDEEQSLVLCAFPTQQCSQVDRLGVYDQLGRVRSVDVRHPFAKV